MRYFRKKVPDTAVLLGNGNWLRFEKISPDLGVFQTDDTAIINEFHAAIRENRGGGIVEITSDEYAGLKKKPGSSQPSNSPRSNAASHNPTPQPNDAVVALAAEEGRRVAPVEKESFRIGKIVSDTVVGGVPGYRPKSRA